MKKLIYLLMALPLLFVSCDDDDDLPKVKIGIETSGCKIVDGTIYVVQGDTLGIDSISITPIDPKNKVALASVNYFWDRMYVETTNIPPFAFAITTGNLMTGRHLLQMRGSVLAVNYAPAIAYIDYTVMVVESAEDIPSGKVETAMIVTPDIDD